MLSCKVFRHSPKAPAIGLALSAALFATQSNAITIVEFENTAQDTTVSLKFDADFEVATTLWSQIYSLDKNLEVSITDTNLTGSTAFNQTFVAEMFSNQIRMVSTTSNSVLNFFHNGGNGISSGAVLSDLENLWAIGWDASGNQENRFSAPGEGFSYAAASVPEPSTTFLLCAGLLALATVTRSTK